MLCSMELTQNLILKLIKIRQLCYSTIQSLEIRDDTMPSGKISDDLLVAETK